MSGRLKGRTVSCRTEPAPADRPAKRGVGRPKGTGGLRVYTELRDRILNMRLSPGEELAEPELVREFGVSRTPVREALIRLDSEGLVVLLPNLRARVAPLDLANTRELLEATEICLRVTTRWAAFRRSDRDLAEMRRHARAFAQAAKRLDFTSIGESNLAFHCAIAQASGNRHFTRLLTTLLSSALRLAQLATTQLPPGYESHEEYLASVVEEHTDLIELIAKRDPGGAEALARKHAADFRDRVMLYVSANLAGTVELDDVMG